MKKLIPFILFIVIANNQFAQDNDAPYKRENVLKDLINRSNTIFEGQIVSKNQSFRSKKDHNIYSWYTLKVDHVLLGNIQVGSIEVVMAGGNIMENGEGIISESAHPGFCAGNAIFFCKPFTQGDASTKSNNIDSLTLTANICINGDGSISPNPNPYPYNESFRSKQEVYNELRKYSSITVPKEYISLGQQQNANTERALYLKTVTDASTVIFVGKVLKKNKSFWGINENKTDIYTSFTVQVDEVLFGEVKAVNIEIVIYGGQMEKDGIGTAIENAHGTGLCSGTATFFCKPFTKGSSGIINSNTGDFELISNYCDKELNANADNSSYSSKKELYEDVAKFKSITIPQEKGHESKRKPDRK